MNFDEIRAVCENRITTNWTNTDIAFDNSNFEVPDGAWIRCFLSPITTVNASLGGLSKRDYAAFTMQIFVPLNEGTGLAYQYAAELEELFSNISIDGVVFYTAETQRVGDEGNGWFMVTVRAQCWAQTAC